VRMRSTVTSGTLSFLNSQPTGGDHPCYIATDNTGRWAAVANYSGGNVSLFPIGEDGTLQPYAQVVQHAGSSANRDARKRRMCMGRFFRPISSIFLHPTLVPINCGLPVQKRSNRTVATRPCLRHRAPDGSGPRHFTFSPNKKFAYLVEELSGTVAAYAYKDGRLRFLQRISTHPAGYKGAKGSADIHLSPDGRFLYASNRGDANSIAVFAVAANGRLQLKGIQPTMGVHPRNFTIDPTGRYLLVANRDSDAVVIFRRNAKTGLLRDTGRRIDVPKPVCLQWLK
jgi:6-phosphogluconolactonase